MSHAVHRTCAGQPAAGGRRTTPTTSSAPARRRCSTTREPTFPLVPVTATRMSSTSPLRSALCRLVLAYDDAGRVSSDRTSPASAGALYGRVRRGPAGEGMTETRTPATAPPVAGGTAGAAVSVAEVRSERDARAAVSVLGRVWQREGDK